MTRSERIHVLSVIVAFYLASFARTNSEVIVASAVLVFVSGVFVFSESSSVTSSGNAGDTNGANGAGTP